MGFLISTNNPYIGEPLLTWETALWLDSARLLCVPVLGSGWLNLELSPCLRILLGCMRLCWSEVIPAVERLLLIYPLACPHQLYCHCSCPAPPTSSNTSSCSSSRNCRRSETNLELETSCCPNILAKLVFFCIELNAQLILFDISIQNFGLGLV